MAIRNAVDEREGGRVQTLPNPEGAGWINRRGGEIVSRHRKKERAVEKAAAIARATGAELVIHGRDGSIQKTRTYQGARAKPGFLAVRLDAARRAFKSDAQIAEALGVNRAQVTRWREGRTEPGPENADRVVGLDATIALLTGYLEPGSIRKWLTGINAHLGDRRPVDVLRQGNLSDVVAAIEALKAGSYA